MATAPRATSTHPSFTLSPAERATVAAELAGLSARVAALAARLDRLHAALTVPGEPANRIQVVAAPVTRVSGLPAGHAGPGPVTASEAMPWR